MPYTQWIEAHPELDGLPEDTKKEYYSEYLEGLNEAINQMEE